MFPFLFFLAFFFSFCRIYMDFIPLSVTDFSQAGYFSPACPSLSFGNLKKSQLLFRAVRGSIGVKNRPPGNGRGYNLVTEAKPSPGRGWTGHSPGRMWGGPRYRPCPAPHPPPAGGTFPQGKVKRKTLSWERVDRALPGTGVGRLVVPAWYRPSSTAAAVPLPPGEG